MYREPQLIKCARCTAARLFGRRARADRYLGMPQCRAADAVRYGVLTSPAAIPCSRSHPSSIHSSAHGDPLYNRNAMSAELWPTHGVCCVATPYWCTNKYIKNKSFVWKIRESRPWVSLMSDISETLTSNYLFVRLVVAFISAFHLHKGFLVWNLFSFLFSRRMRGSICPNENRTNNHDFADCAFYHCATTKR